MEYTKDIILNLNYKKTFEGSIIKRWTSNFNKIIKRNKLISITLLLFAILTIIDILLVNSFFNILSEIA